MSSDCEGRTQEDIGKDIEEWRARAEESIITCYEKRKAAEDDWNADAADTLENN